jgi:hypothetical protein
MARKKDAEEDKQSRIALRQFNSKKVGFPNPNTYASADQMPDTKLSLSDYDKVRSAMNAELDNLEAINIMNTIGRAANLIGYGPMPDTQVVLDITSITNSNKDVYVPNPGEVWQLVAASIITLDGASTMILNIIDKDTSNLVQIDTFNATSNPMELNEPIYISNTAYLSVRTSNASSGNARLGVSVIRVR